MKIFALLLFNVIAITSAIGQNFSAEASLPEIEKDGFVKVLLTPEVCAYLKEDFSDARLFDASGKEVPYIIEAEKVSVVERTFKGYEIVQRAKEKGCCSYFIMHNSERSAINNISLVIKNADVRKRGRLLGSDDRDNWFALKEDVRIHAVNNVAETFEVKILDFPLSNYEFYKLEMDDSSSAPLNIVSAGYYTTSTASDTYTEVSETSFTAVPNEKDKQTIVDIRFDTARLVDKVEFIVGGFPYYHRKASLYALVERKTKKGAEQYQQFIQTLEISSQRVPVADLNGIKVSLLRLIIENEDNPPLDVIAVHSYQLNRYLVAWIKGGSGYSLKMGDRELRHPNYDLLYFRDSIQGDAKVIMPAKVTVRPMLTAHGTEASFFTSKVFIWVAIAVVIGVLGLLSYRMVRDVNSSQQ